MNKVIKVLNNNTVLIKDNNDETIIIFKGIGFGKKENDIIDIPSNAKKYTMQKAYQSKNTRGDFIDFVDPIYLEIAAEILKAANDKFDYVNNDILLPLADHLLYAIKRMDEDLMPSNPFTYDIQLLFPDEYEVAKQSKDIIKEKINKEINNDEIGFITLHIHSAVSNDKVSQTMEATQVVHEQIKLLEQELNITITNESISYTRLMNHIKFLILRINKGESLEMDITEFTKDKFPYAYQKAKIICKELSIALSKTLPDNEIGYLALHVERILSNSIN